MANSRPLGSLVNLLIHQRNRWFATDGARVPGWRETLEQKSWGVNDERTKGSSTTEPIMLAAPHRRWKIRLRLSDL